MILKIILIIAGTIVGSFYLSLIIAVGVSAGLKNYFDKGSKR